MFKSVLKVPGSSLCNQIRNVSTKSTEPVLPHLTQIPNYVLATLRTFPSLEPKSTFPVSRTFLNAPLRRDILWKAVVHEANCARVGASNPPGRSELGYSGKKLMRQKGNGRARVGDRGSPIRHDGGRALARSAPNDYSTEIQFKVYASAIKIALSSQWRNGKLFIIGGEKPVENYENNITEFISDDPVAALQFLQKHELLKKNLLFIVNGPRPNLQKATEKYENIDIISKEFIEVRDILKSQATFVEMGALTYFADVYGEQ